MKKKCVVLLAALLCVSMSACTSEAEKVPETETAPENGQRIEVEENVWAETEAAATEAESVVIQKTEAAQSEPDSLTSAVLGRWYFMEEYKSFYMELSADGTGVLKNGEEELGLQYKVDEKSGRLTAYAPETNVTEELTIIQKDGNISLSDDDGMILVRESEYDAVRGGTTKTMLIGKWYADGSEESLEFFEDETCIYRNGEKEVLYKYLITSSETAIFLYNQEEKTNSIYDEAITISTKGTQVILKFKLKGELDRREMIHESDL